MSFETGNSKDQDGRDEANEAALTAAMVELQCSPTAAGRRAAWSKLQTLHAQRSAGLVRSMEERAGLAAGAGSSPR